MLRRLALSVSVLLAAAFCASGQFYADGENPWSLKWYQIQTQNYRIVYPEGLDSLVRVYGSALEKYRIPTGRSVGFAPNEAYRSRMPVILEAWRADANGSVAWTPRRMQLYTCMDALSPDTMPWLDNLAVHEGRHVAQMQFTNAGHFKALGWLTGELAAGGLVGAYGGRVLFEGDAVVAETALSSSGRGRRGDWLEAYKQAFAEGDWRSVCRWRYGSIVNYTPDYYTLGYMWYAGMRCFYDEPFYVKKYYDKVLSHKWWWFPFKDHSRTTKEITGMRRRDTWSAICGSFEDIWQANEAQRGPFPPDSLFTSITSSRHYTSMRGSTSAGENIFSIMGGYASNSYLVKSDSRGKVEKLSSFSGRTSDLRYSHALGRIYWSEIISDPRWAMKSTSRIRYYDPESGRKVSITGEGRFYNPSPSDSLLTVTEYPIAGGSAICLMDARSGEVLRKWQAPDSLQVVESATLDGHIYATGISPAGFGIYMADEGYKALLAPQPVNINCLQEHDGKLWYTSDLSGVRETYCIDGQNITQVTNTRFGMSSFTFAEGSDDIFYSELSKNNRLLHRAPLLSLEPAPRYEDPVAAKLSEQERALGPAPSDTAVFSEVKRYRKALHALRIHSWAPVYFNIDNVSSLSFDSIYQTSALGATALFQNDLQTLCGQAGLSIHNERVSSHVHLTYSGLYPVIETHIDYNDRPAWQYGYQTLTARNGSGWSIVRADTPKASLSGDVKVYVPLLFQSGGWSRGIVPQLKCSFSNDIFNTSSVNMKYLERMGTEDYMKVLSSIDTAPAFTMCRLISSLRAYAVQGTPVACVYPRLGIGLELGCGLRPGLQEFFSPAAYAYLYGYLPGFAPGHGIRLSAIGQKLSDGALRSESYVSATPRGFAPVSSELSSFMASRSPLQARITADYKAAVLPVEWSIFDYFLYIRNFEIGAHFDGTAFSGGTSTKPDAINSGSLFSAGVSLAAHLGSLCWIGIDTTAGVECSFNGGRSYAALEAAEIPVQRVYCGLIFTTNF